MTIFKRMLADQKGVAAVEYGLLAALISLSAMGALGKVGDGLSNTFNKVGAVMERSNARAAH